MNLTPEELGRLLSESFQQAKQSQPDKLVWSETATLFARRLGVQELRQSLEESLALIENVFGEAEPELISYYSEHKIIIKQARAALAKGTTNHLAWEQIKAAFPVL